MAGELPKRTVLLVDDSKFVRATFKRILEASFAVREEADGEAGWRAIEGDASIVMVFTDLDMPRLDGFALLERIRGSREARIRTLPVVIISGNEGLESKNRALKLGANDFIGKSADAPEVMSRLDGVLRLVNASKELEASRQALDVARRRRSEGRPAPTAAHLAIATALAPRYMAGKARQQGGRLVSKG